jgi:hypothetical protein
MVRQVRQDGKIDVVLDEALSVLAEAELFEPLRNLRHPQFPCRCHRRLTRFRDQGERRILSEKLLRREKKSPLLSEAKSIRPKTKIRGCVVMQGDSR